MGAQLEFVDLQTVGSKRTLRYVRRTRDDSIAEALKFCEKDFEALEPAQNNECKNDYENTESMPAIM